MSLSAKKRDRQNAAKRMQHREIKSSTRTEIKKFRAAVAAGKIDEAKQLYLSSESLIDKAVTKGVFHKNNGARKISRLASELNKISK